MPFDNAQPAARILPWASASPPWSGPHPSQIGETYGTLFATPVAAGHWMLTHLPNGDHFAMTVKGEPGEVVEMYGRRWSVEHMVGPVPVNARSVVRSRLEASIAAGA